MLETPSPSILANTTQYGTRIGLTRSKSKESNPWISCKNIDAFKKEKKSCNAKKPFVVLTGTLMNIRKNKHSKLLLKENQLTPWWKKTIRQGFYTMWIYKPAWKG